MADVQLRLTQLQQAVAAGGEYFSPVIAERAKEDLRLAYERMRVGDGFVVTALIGGTGSGKSTLFNRLTSLHFAEVSEIRPTTNEIMACTWGGDSSELLDVLAVSPHNRIQHESLLTIGAETHDALVLLDTPDYDSVDITHSGTVSTLIPMVDVILWVLDPQKYADLSVYSSLITLGRRHENMHMHARDAHTLAVVINRIDTVAHTEREALIAHVRANLEELGFGDVPVYATSALYGEGMESLAAALTQMTTDRTLWHATAGAQLDSVAELLGSQVGDFEVDVHDGYVHKLAVTVVEASGVRTVAKAIEEGVSQETMAPQAPAPTLSVALRDMWVTHAIAGVPPTWQAGIEREILSADSLRKRISRALANVPVPKVCQRLPWMQYVIGGVLAVCGVCLIIAGIAPWIWLHELVGAYLPLLLPSGCVLALVGILVMWIGQMRARAAICKARIAAARSYENSVSAAVADTLSRALIPGVEAIVKRHKAARTLLMGARADEE